MRKTLNLIYSIAFFFALNCFICQPALVDENDLAYNNSINENSSNDTVIFKEDSFLKNDTNENYLNYNSS